MFIVEQVTRTILKKMVCSAPRYFPDAEQRSVMNAALIAGLNCLPHMNENTAVTLASTSRTSQTGPLVVPVVSSLMQVYVVIGSVTVWH